MQKFECSRCGNFRIREGVDIATFQYFQYQSSKSFSESDYLNIDSVIKAKIENAPQRLGKKGSRKRANASAWLFHHQGMELSFEDIYNLVSVKPPPVTERISLLLKEVAHDSDYIGAPVDLKNPKYISVSWSLSTEECSEIISYLRKSGYISAGEKIAQKGWEYLESIDSDRAHSSQVFIAMSFSNDMARASDSIKDAIQSCDLRPVRVDDIEHLEKIDDKIMYEIRQSRCIVADLTKHKTGVYFEAGYAMGLGIPVIWSCRKDNRKKLHFDIRQYNCIIWANENELKVRLSRRLSSIL
ncbi:MAG: hypothetical protein ACUZ8I_08205 [Candidatus Scalindua sp.]